MKIEVGAQFVSKFIQMGVDMKSSRESTESFQKLPHKGTIDGVELGVQVLTTTLWGESKNALCLFPPELKSCSDSFDKYYKEVHSGRHLIWSSMLGSCEIKTLIYPKQYTLIVSVLQACVLSLYNNNTDFTFQKLSEASMITPDVLANSLYHLTNNRLGKILIKDNLRTPKLTPEEHLKLNMNYAQPTLRVCLNAEIEPKVLPIKFNILERED